MLRFAIGSVALAGLLAGCSQSRCAPGEVPNDVLQGCVKPKECDESMVVNDRNQCVIAQSSTAATDAGAHEVDSAPSTDASDDRNAAAGATAGNGAAGQANAGTPSTAGSASDAAGTPEPHCGNGIREGAELCDGADCPSECASADPCLVIALEGASATCDARCSDAAAIAVCMSGDGCCAKECTYAQDIDCSKSCGDGVVNEPELCEPTSTEKPCPALCDDGDPCTEDVKTGTPEQCNIACSHMPIAQAVNADGCCPLPANANTDDDCAASCGNGVVEDGETCDGDCPTACDDDDPCTTGMSSGSARECDLTCVHAAISAPRSGDGCCPEGADANMDSDCAASCGNGVVEDGETCDGDCPTACDDQNPCTHDGVSGSANRCTAECGHTPLQRPAMNCNDGNPCTKDEAVPSATSCTFECKRETMERPTMNCNDDNPCTKDEAVPSATSCTFECKRETMERPAMNCNDGNPCTKDEAVPSATSCTFECSRVAITAVQNGDGCCPSGASNVNDSDCGPPPTCGNGLLDSGEKCDDSNSRVRCPVTNSDCRNRTGDPCWMWRVEGAGCQRECVHAAGICQDIIDPFEDISIRACRNDCPPGFDPNDPWD